MNIGDYVRTKEGEIIKITSYNEQKDNPLWEVINGTATMKGSIMKSSSNIIDLIEVGDYVNGCKILDKTLLKEKNSYVVTVESSNDSGLYCHELKFVYNEDIKSILTKEQYESMEYKI